MIDVVTKLRQRVAMDRHGKYRKKNRIALRKKADEYRYTQRYTESAEWTMAHRCLNGTATENEYMLLKKCYASYNGDFVYVGPNFGPFTITGENALKAWNRVTKGEIE